MTNSEEIAKAREFLREVRAVCRKHGMQINAHNITLVKNGSEKAEICARHVALLGSCIDLNEG